MSSLSQIRAVINIVRRDGEEKSANIESVRPTTAQAPYMSRSKPAFEVAVFPGMIQMIVRIGATGVMSHPVVIFRMRSFRVVRLIVEFPVLILRRCRPGSGSTYRSRTVCRYVTIPHSVLTTITVPASFTAVLIEQRQSDEQPSGE